MATAASKAKAPRAKRAASVPNAVEPAATAPTPEARQTTDANRRESAESLNAIRPARARRPLEAAPAPDQAKATPLEGTSRPNGNDSDRSIPPQVADRFVQVGNKFFFANGDPAFRDRGNRLTTKTDNTEVIRSLLEIAKARGWERLQVSGTDRFRREAWQQATLAGFQVRGYRPNAVEQATLARRIDQQRTNLRSEDRDAGPATTDPSTTAERATVRSPRSDVAQERVYRGRLVDYGAASFQFNPREPASFYLRLQTSAGEQVLWGRDLERAIGKSLSQVKAGDEVAVRQVGERPVTIRRPRLDEDGRVQGEESVVAYRNRWLVEREDFLQSRAQLARTVRDPQSDPKQAARQRPELTGTFLELRAAELVAKEAYADLRDQARFVSRVREAIAAEIERGEPLSAVRVRQPERYREPAGARKPERSALRVLG